MAYTNNRPGRATTPLTGTNVHYPPKASFVQLVASSMKNSTGGAFGTRTNGVAKFWSIEEHEFVFAGWDHPGNHVVRTYLTMYNRTIYDSTTLFLAEIGVNYVVAESENEYADIVNDPPQWTYAVKFGLDKRDYLQRINYPGANLPTYNPGTTNSFLRAGYNALYNNAVLRQDLAVGLNQIGQVKFIWGITKQVTHHYWFKVNETAGAGPLTIHELVLHSI